MLYPYGEKKPEIDSTALIVPNATVIGDVTIGADSSLWFQVVVRGDVNYIRIGKRTNIQDGSVIHVTNRTHPTIVGDDVTVGHNVTLHGCTIGDRCLLGIGSIVLDGVDIGDDCMIGAGALITPATKIPPGSLVLGAPAKVRRDLSSGEIAFLKQSALNYIEYKTEYDNLFGVHEDH